MPMNASILAAIALTLLQVTSTGAVNLEQCLERVKNGEFGTGRIGGTDNQGNILEDVRNATGVTYKLCVDACGAGQEPFHWSVFSQQFSSWLLPWLALVSQLPFGPKDKLDNLESVLLTVGSPMLASYSLALTVLNGRWVTRRLSSHNYPNIRNAIRVLSSLQQSPLRVTDEGSLLTSLVVLPQNDEWWRELIEWLEYPHTWSISAVTSIAWVVIAYIFTVVDSFMDNLTTTINANGQGVGSLWLWLLPLVLGWLQISPKCDEVRLKSAIDRANNLAYVATNTHPVPARQVTEQRAIFLALTEDDPLRRDERNTAPIFNYARFLPWMAGVEAVSEVFRAASDRYQHHESVDPNIAWVEVDRSQKPHERNRVGSITQVGQYCDTDKEFARRRSRWGPNVFSRIAVASLLAFTLQWGTVGAAFIVVYHTPTTGLGCRSASYLLFGVLSTVVWMLLLTSSVLSHYASAEPRTYKGHSLNSWSTAVARRISIALRRLGKVVAVFNAFWIVVTCFFQFSNFFDRCYCNSSVFGRRNLAYNVIEPLLSDVSEMRAAWIGGVCLAGGTAIIFIGFVNMYIDPPLPKERS